MRNRPVTDFARFFFALVLLFACGAQVRAQTWTINWTKYENTIPAISDGASTNGKIPLGNAGRGDPTFAYSPSVLKDGSTYKMWYTGYDGANMRIYHATSSNGLEWAKYTNTIPANSDSNSTGGRIPLGTAGKGDTTRVFEQQVIKDGDTYKMWYTGADDGTTYRIYHATSSNGLEWAKYDNTIPANSDTTSTNGKIPLGSSGKGDSTYVNSPFVLKDASTYKMWYTGYDDGGTIFRIYHATSSNGLEWTKYTNAIPANSDSNSTGGRIPLGTAGRGDDAGVMDPKVIKVGDTYKMWYTGLDGVNLRIYHATSSNGLEWTKLDNTIPPVSDTTNSNSRVGLGTQGDNTHVRTPAVILVGERDYKMWYSGYNANYRIYHATGLGPPPPAGTIFTFR